MLDNHQDMFRGYPLTLACGVTVFMTSLHQQVTYHGVLEGLPDQAFNDQLITGLRSRCHLLYEVRTPFRFAEPRLNRKPFEFLPYLTCTADLLAVAPVRDETADLSSLSVCWFQDTWALPLAPAAAAALQALDWQNLATDGWF